MLSALTVLLKSDRGEEFRSITMNSVLLADADIKVVEVSLEDAGRAAEETSADVVLFIQPGTLIAPDYFRAMLTTMEHRGVDYVVCRCAVVSKSAEKPVVVGVSEKGKDMAQVMVRRWVYHEIGAAGKSPQELVEKVMGEYRGGEVPHVLVTRV